VTTECPVNTEHIINDDAYFACRDVSLYLYLYRSLFSLYRREEEADDDGNGVDDDDGNDLGDGDGDDGVDDNHGDRRDDADQGDDVAMTVTRMTAMPVTALLSVTAR